MRRRAREAALSVLFQMDVGKASLEDALATVRDDWPPDDWTLIETLVRGTRSHLSALDALIARTAERYSTEESGRFVNGLLGKVVRSGIPPLVGQAAET